MIVISCCLIVLLGQRANAVPTSQDEFTIDAINYHAHAILVWQQEEREQLWEAAHAEEHRRQDALTAAALAEKHSKVSSTSSNKVVSSPTSTGTGRWDALAQCESGGNWAANTGNGYFGGIQFSETTWKQAGGTGLPHQNSRETQIAIAESWLAKTSWAQWPTCSRKLGFR